MREGTGEPEKESRDKLGAHSIAKNNENMPERRGGQGCSGLGGL